MTDRDRGAVISSGGRQTIKKWQSKHFIEAHHFALETKENFLLTAFASTFHGWLAGNGGTSDSQPIIMSLIPLATVMKFTGGNEEERSGLINQ